MHAASAGQSILGTAQFMARIVGAHISPFDVSRKEVVCGERRLAPWKLWWHPPFEGDKVAVFSDEEDQSQLRSVFAFCFDSDGDRVHDLHGGKSLLK